jgi:hypothetical protein
MTEAPTFPPAFTASGTFALGMSQELPSGAMMGVVAMFEGLFQPVHLLVGIAMLLIVGTPVFLIGRWLWRKGSKSH